MQNPRGLNRMIIACGKSLGKLSLDVQPVFMTCFIVIGKIFNMFRCKESCFPLWHSFQYDCYPFTVLSSVHSKAFKCSSNFIYAGLKGLGICNDNFPSWPLRLFCIAVLWGISWFNFYGFMWRIYYVVFSRRFLLEIELIL